MADLLSFDFNETFAVCASVKLISGSNYCPGFTWTIEIWKRLKMMPSINWLFHLFMLMCMNVFHEFKNVCFML